MEGFGPTLRRLRMERGWSLRQLSAKVNYDFGYLGQLERGSRPPTAAVAAACERTLEASGVLLQAFEDAAAETEMQRRTVLRALGTLAGAGPTLVSLEALRQGLGQVLDADHDEWEQVAADYGRAFYTTPADILIEQVGSDLRVLQEMLAMDRGGHTTQLARAAGRLSVVLAMALAAVGQLHMARRFWRSASKAAQRAGDPDTRVLVAAWNAVNGCYDGRPAGEVVGLTDAARPAAGTRATAATAGLFAARAQALALAGRGDDARAAVRIVESITERLPADVSADVVSLWGWPEHRLRHTESFVYTHIGDTAAAFTAQDRAQALYPPEQARLRTQVELHRAACLILQGHIGDGLRHAAGVFDSLPAELHNAKLREVVRQVIAAVPETDRSRREALALRERLPAIQSV